jgi:hypothetical protein
LHLTPFSVFVSSYTKVGCGTRDLEWSRRSGLSTGEKFKKLSASNNKVSEEEVVEVKIPTQCLLLTVLLLSVCGWPWISPGL